MLSRYVDLTFYCLVCFGHECANKLYHTQILGKGIFGMQ